MPDPRRGAKGALPPPKATASHTLPPEKAEEFTKNGSRFISRDTDPLIIDARCMARVGAKQKISYGTCEECRRKYSFLGGDIETY